MDDGLEVVLLRTSGEIMDSMHHLFGEYVASAATLSDYPWKMQHQFFSDIM